MVFKKAVKSIPQIANCYCDGKSALGANSNKVREADARKLQGSVDLDKCVLDAYPNDNRWDYVLGYHGHAYFVEVHPASTSDVETMINKFNWLKNWLRSQGTPLNAMKSADPFHWVFTNRNTIAKNSTYERRLIKAGLGKPKRELVLK